MKISVIILAVVLLGCQPSDRSLSLLNDKYLHLNTKYTNEVFNDSICRIAQDSARRRIENGQFELYVFFNSDSSDTPIHLLKSRFGLNVLGVAGVDNVFKFCFNEGMISEFVKNHRFNPLDSVLSIYDSLDSIGMTNIQPKFVGGTTEFKRYMICTLEFPEGIDIVPPYPIVEISFRISPTGYPDKVLVMKSHSPKYDSAAMKVIRMMPKWSPARGNDGKYEEQSIQFRFKFDPVEREIYCQ